MRQILASNSKTFYIGKVGENDSARIAFPIADLAKQIAATDFSLSVLKPKSGQSSYYTPANIQISEDKTYLYWIPSIDDLSAYGRGYAQVSASNGIDTAKSPIYSFIISDSLH